MTCAEVAARFRPWVPPNSSTNCPGFREVERRAGCQKLLKIADENRDIELCNQAADNAPPFPYTPPVQKSLALLLVVAAFVMGLLLAALLAVLILRRATTPTFATTPTVVVQIQSLSELVTVKYVLEKVIPVEAPHPDLIDNLPILSGLRDDKLILLAHGIVKAGVDLSQLKDSDVHISGKKIRIDLPPAVVTDGYLDENGTQVLDRKTGLLRPVDKKLEQQARQYARSEIMRAARKAGIEREAGERARDQLTKLFQSLGYEEVDVRIRNGK